MFSKQHTQTRKAFHRGFKLEIISKDERINIKIYFKSENVILYGCFIEYSYVHLANSCLEKLNKCILRSHSNSSGITV